MFVYDFIDKTALISRVTIEGDDIIFHSNKSEALEFWNVLATGLLCVHPKGTIPNPTFSITPLDRFLIGINSGTLAYFQFKDVNRYVNLAVLCEMLIKKQSDKEWRQKKFY